MQLFSTDIFCKILDIFFLNMCAQGFSNLYTHQYFKTPLCTLSFWIDPLAENSEPKQAFFL